MNIKIDLENIWSGDDWDSVASIIRQEITTTLKGVARAELKKQRAQLEKQVKKAIEGLSSADIDRILKGAK